MFVEVKTADNVATVKGLTQGYIVCEADKRFLMLFTFLKKMVKKKVMVSSIISKFFSFFATFSSFWEKMISRIAEKQ